MSKFTFSHLDFKTEVKEYFTLNPPKDKATKQDVDAVVSGLSIATWKFIILCNEMGVNPNKFIKEVE